METYEEKYKDLVKRLNKAREEKGVYTFNSVLDAVAPELKIDESEDERIRKWLICLLNSMQYHHCDDEREMGNKALAWLENRGEQKSIKVPKFKVGDFIQFNGMGHTRYTIKEVCGLSHYINTCNKRMDMSYTDANFELVEQKSAAWSEEDESHIRYLIECLEHCKKGVSLTMTTPTAQEYIDWLKFLRPQSHWKPSDEQMEALIETCVFKKSTATGAVLCELYHDLEKLREE